MTTRHRTRGHQVQPRQLPEQLDFPQRPRRSYDPAIRERPTKSIKRTWIDMGTGNTRTDILAPNAGHQIRIARIWVVVNVAEGADRLLELYFGNGATISTTPSKAIDTLTLKAIGTYSTRAYDVNSLDGSPVGLRGDAVSYRWVVAVSSAHRLFIEYRQQDSNRITQ